MKKLQKLMLVAVLGLSSISQANENESNISQNTYDETPSTQTSQKDILIEMFKGLKHRYAVGLGYGFQSIAFQEISGSDKNKRGDNFNSVYVLGNYQILYPNNQYSHITSGIEFMAGLGYAHMHQRVKTYSSNSLISNERLPDTYSALNLDLGVLKVLYYPLPDDAYLKLKQKLKYLPKDISFGFKFGFGYSMQYVPNGDTPLNNSYGILLGTEVDTKRFAIGLLYGYYFGAHQSRLGSTWSLAGDGMSLYSNKVQVYGLYKF